MYNKNDIDGQMALVIAECPNVSLFFLRNNNRDRLIQGQMKLVQLQESKTYFIEVNQFQQNIIGGTPFVKINSDKGLSLIFPNIELGLNGLFIPKMEEQQYFMSQLQTIVQIIPYDQAMQIPQFKETIDMHCNNINISPLENEHQVANLIEKGGDTLKTGMVWFGGMVAQAINKGGQYVTSKVDQGQPNQTLISESTKTKLTTIKDKTGQAVESTIGLMKIIFDPLAQKTKEAADSISQKIDQSDSTFFKEGKVLTTATFDAANKTLQGFATALQEVGESITTNTKQLIQKKYGGEFNENVNQAQDKEQEQELVQPLLVEKNADIDDVRKPTVDGNPYPKLE